ncbi:hypothetical protein, partial [Ralstonia solanacearum]|uniref:hypothetical protein n=1 Tax=Ralstonia solanacearum TaxID=305 RepID=UPI001E4CC268
MSELLFVFPRLTVEPSVQLMLTLPLPNESLAEPINSSKERSNDKQGKAGAVHAGIQAGGG